MQRKSKSKGRKESTKVPCLSSIPMEDIRNKVYDAINEKELEDSIKSWVHSNKKQKDVDLRDLEILSGNISEYLDSFIIFGYNLKDERVIIQHYDTPKERDAMMEFLKIVFFKYQNEAEQEDDNGTDLY